MAWKWQKLARSSKYFCEMLLSEPLFVWLFMHKYVWRVSRHTQRWTRKWKMNITGYAELVQYLLSYTPQQSLLAPFTGVSGFGQRAAPWSWQSLCLAQGFFNRPCVCDPCPPPLTQAEVSTIHVISGYYTSPTPNLSLECLSRQSAL